MFFIKLVKKKNRSVWTSKGIKVRQIQRLRCGSFPFDLVIKLSCLCCKLSMNWLKLYLQKKCFILCFFSFHNESWSRLCWISRKIFGANCVWFSCSCEKLVNFLTLLNFQNWRVGLRIRNVLLFQNFKQMTTINM